MKRILAGIMIVLCLCLLLLPGTAIASDSPNVFAPIVDDFDKPGGRCLLYDVDEDGVEELILSYSDANYDVVDWNQFSGIYGYDYVEIYKAVGNSADLIENYTLMKAVGVMEYGSLGVYNGHCYFVTYSQTDGMGSGIVNLLSFTTAPDHKASWRNTLSEKDNGYITEYEIDGNSCTEQQYVAFQLKITTIYSFVEGKEGDTKIGLSRDELLAQLSSSVTLPDATKYVPYEYVFPAGWTYSIVGGSLPKGMSMSVAGILSGMPEELGVFSFTVSCSGVQYAYTLSVLWQGGVDVEQYNEPGYGFVETAADNGRVKNQSVVSLAELEPQAMHLEGPYSEFRGLYLDGRLLKRGEEYTARPGSVVIDVLEETLEEAGSGTHVLSAEFQTNDGNGVLSTKYTTQKYTITGIPGKDVTVIVNDVIVIWSDAEPYINSDNRTMVPFRVIANALGLTVDWDGATREAIFSDGTKTIYFPLDSKTARTSTGGMVAMDTAAVSINGRSYAPVRYLAEFFGFTVTWDGQTRTVGIS